MSVFHANPSTSLRQPAAPWIAVRNAVDTVVACQRDLDVIVEYLAECIEVDSTPVVTASGTLEGHCLDLHAFHCHGSHIDWLTVLDWRQP